MREIVFMVLCCLMSLGIFYIDYNYKKTISEKNTQIDILEKEKNNLIEEIRLERAKKILDLNRSNSLEIHKAIINYGK